MLGTYFYHEIIRKTIISFGTLFNNIYIRHTKSDGSILDETKVGISYGPMQKFLAKIQEQEQLTKPIATTLPRMSFEMINIQYDQSRKTGVTQTFKASDGSNLKKVFMPVPYNIGFELNIFSKLNDDALQIIEQILPFFQPSFNVTVNLVDSIGEKRDIPIVLNSISFNDEYEGSFQTRRALIYTLRFTAKSYLFGPISNDSEGLIKKVQVDYYSNNNTVNASRQKRYISEPKAIKDYNNDSSTILTKEVNKEDSFILVQNSSSISPNSYIQIDNEVLFVKKIENNRLLVERSQYNTFPDFHPNDSIINVINESDDDLLIPGDDFGFSEYRYDFNDGKIYSPSRDIDI